jgi:hypothetical protein
VDQLDAALAVKLAELVGIELPHERAELVAQTLREQLAAAELSSLDTSDVTLGVVFDASWA